MHGGQEHAHVWLQEMHPVYLGLTYVAQDCYNSLVWVWGQIQLHWILKHSSNNYIKHYYHCFDFYCISLKGLLISRTYRSHLQCFRIRHYLAHLQYGKPSNKKSRSRSWNMISSSQWSIDGNRNIWFHILGLGYQTNQMLRWVREKEAVWVTGIKIQPWLCIPVVHEGLKLKKDNWVYL